jgi:hypothetical protein
VQHAINFALSASLCAVLPVSAFGAAFHAPPVAIGAPTSPSPPVPRSGISSSSTYFFFFFGFSSSSSVAAGVGGGSSFLQAAHPKGPATRSRAKTVRL